MSLPDPNTLLTLQELADELGISKTTVNRWKARRDVTHFPEPVFQMGHTHFYSRKEVEQWHKLWKRTEAKGGQYASKQRSLTSR